jgi:Short C-terminal domain
MRAMSRGRLYRSIAGYLVGVGLGTACLTLVFLGMRSVMEIGGACAEGGPYVAVQPCPDGAPLALIGGAFGAFGAAGLMIWFGSRLGRGYTLLVLLGWPALFISLGFNFLQFGLNPPPGGSGGVEWGFLIPGVLFWIMGFGPLLFGFWAWRAARSGRETSSVVTMNRLADSVTVPNRVSEPERIEYAPNSFGAPRPASPTAASDDDVDEALVDKLERLSTLHAGGSLSDEEFAEAKARILANQSLDA